MKCPECIAEDERSKVFDHGGMVTDMYFAPFYDEDGNRHQHDMNWRTSHFTCSRGHDWHESWQPKCWCQQEEVAS